MNYIKCPKCQAEIEEDSYFCDQCGVELHICPSCGVLGKGKRCTRCGKPLVAKKDAGTIPPTPAAVPSDPIAKSTVPIDQPVINNNPVTTTQPTGDVQPPVAQVSTFTPQPAANDTADGGFGSTNASATVRPGSPAPPQTPNSTPPGHLVCQNPPIRLLVTDVLIGRREGGYASVFGVHGMVSGRHAAISQSPSGEWQVTDLGSTNGTFINGAPLKPNVPANIHVGDTLTFANLDFQVTP